jgi:tRNA 5-methylaminomethyl-2-thiouridine biosynthesis bifunctional protein
VIDQTKHLKTEHLKIERLERRSENKGYQIRPSIAKPEHVAIIGGGIAAACLAYALTQKNIKVTLYCKDETVAQGASSNHIGALFPLIHQQVDNISLFYQQAFSHAIKCYKNLYNKGFSFSHDWCGLLEISYKSALEKRQQVFQQSSPWPKALITSVNAKEASKLAGIKLKHGGLFMPSAGWIAPAELVQQLFIAAKQTQHLTIKNNVNIKALHQQSDESWQLETNHGLITEKLVIFCGGAESIKLNVINDLPLTSVRGQVTNMKTNEHIQKLSTVICHKGYLTPANQQQHCIGATFEKNSFNTNATAEDDKYNLTMLEKCLPKLVTWTEQDITASKARLRCMTPDHLPMVGAMPNLEQHKKQYAHLAKDKNWRYQEAAPVIKNLYLLTGLGARGLCTAPLLADILTADLTGEEYPVDKQALFNLSPNRFVIRDIIRRKFL